MKDYLCPYQPSHSFRSFSEAMLLLPPFSDVRDYRWRWLKMRGFFVVPTYLRNNLFRDACLAQMLLLLRHQVEMTVFFQTFGSQVEVRLPCGLSPWGAMELTSQGELLATSLHGFRRHVKMDLHTLTFNLWPSDPAFTCLFCFWCWLFYLAVFIGFMQLHFVLKTL